MSKESLWNRFAETGSVGDYLRYSALRDTLHDDNRGDRPEGTPGRGAGQIH